MFVSELILQTWNVYKNFFHNNVCQPILFTHGWKLFKVRRAFYHRCGQTIWEENNVFFTHIAYFFHITFVEIKNRDKWKNSTYSLLLPRRIL